MESMKKKKVESGRECGGVHELGQPELEPGLVRFGMGLALKSYY